jgi:hypothetical protein
MSYYKNGKSVSGIKYWDLLGYHPDFIEMNFLKIGANILLSEAREKEDPYWKYNIPKKAYVFCGGLSSVENQKLTTHDCVICLFFIYDNGYHESELNISRVKFNTLHETVLGYDIVWKSEKKVPLRWNKSSLYPLQKHYLKTMDSEYRRIDPRLEDYVITDRNNHGIEHVICMFYESNKNDFRFKELNDKLFTPIEVSVVESPKEVVEEVIKKVVVVPEVTAKIAPTRDSKGRFISSKVLVTKEVIVEPEVKSVSPKRDSKGRFISTKTLAQ